MTQYQLWFRFGAPTRTNVQLLTAILQDAKLLTVTTNKGRIECELLTKNKTTIKKAIHEYYQRPWWERLVFSFKVARGCK